MNSDPDVWRAWAEKLNRWGMGDFVAAFLDAAGPLTLVGAQAIYIGQPFIKEIFSKRQLEEITSLLEDPQQAKAFTAYLREENPR